MELDYIEATTEVGNLQSQRLLKKMGLVQMKDLKDGLFHFTLRDRDGVKK